MTQFKITVKGNHAKCEFVRDFILDVFYFMLQYSKVQYGRIWCSILQFSVHRRQGFLNAGGISCLIAACAKL